MRQLGYGCKLHEGESARQPKLADARAEGESLAIDLAIDLTINLTIDLTVERSDVVLLTTRNG